jgi:hypothetical protein
VIAAAVISAFVWLRIAPRYRLPLLLALLGFSALGGLISFSPGVVVMTMNILDLTPQQLKRAASIKEQIDR